MRLRLIPVVALVSAAIGAGGALAIARAAGWVGTKRTETLVVPAPKLQPAARPLVVRGVDVVPALGNRFDPAAIYAARSPGVVTLYSQFAGGEEAQGSGFVVSSGGVVLTNAHVIVNAPGPSTRPVPAEHVYVEFADGDRVAARIVGWDVFDDVGVLRVSPSQHALSPVPLGNSAAVRVGDAVAVIGSPFGNENSLTVGVVSATKRSIDSLTSFYELLDAIQTDAPINHGNSGGPMFDGRGRVIGIAAQIRSATGNAEGVGFAVPIDSARRSMLQLLHGGRVRYAYVGIQTETLTPSIARHFGYSVQRGAIVSAVSAGSPADVAGFHGASGIEDFAGVPTARGGDVVTAVDGARVTNADDLVRIITNRLEPGAVATFSLVRGRTRRTIAVRLAERPARQSER